PGIHPCRDSYGAMAIVLELMAQSGKTPSQLRAEYPSPWFHREKIRIKSGEAPRILRAVRRKYEDGGRLNLQDGVHVDLGDRWLHVRRSNTEPVVRLMIEAEDQASAEALAREVHAEIDKARA
ncbi:MAG: phosphoglucosamine mutase, partial [Verrucomicrobiota bacterium]